MTFKTTQLRDAISFALAVGTTALVGTGVAFAQDTTAAQEEAKTLDRIEVTGSRIRQVDLETAQPVLTISRQDIEKQGFQSVADILQNISATGTPPISRAAPLTAGENAGGTFISLRNLGAARTLVLLNGKRLGISTSGLSDVSTIPAAAVERIEVLKDGASSIYGSDAIAGVINVITRSNYEGAAASAYYGQYSEGDGGITKADFVMGFNGERGSLTAAAEWAKEDVVKASDREYGAFPRSHLHPTDNWTPVGQFGGFQTTATTMVPGVPVGTRVVLREGGDPRNRADYIRQNINAGTCVGATAATGCTPGSTLHKSNTNQQTDIHTPLERKSLYVDGIFDISDDIRFRTNLLYSNRSSDRTVAGYPMQAASFNTPMSAQSYFNPTGATISNWWRRTWEQPRLSNSDLTTYRFSGAFEGSFEFADRFFDWDVSYLNNTNKLVQSSFGNLNLPNTRLAVGPSFLNPATGQVVCGTPDNPATPANDPTIVAGCVPFNPFLPFGRVGQGGLTNNQALSNYLFQEEHSTGETETTVLSANLAGAILTLPAGDLGFAVGVENRKEEGKFVPDALAVTGASTNLSAGPTGGDYTVDEVYAELQIPILADLPFARELSLNIASRYSDYDTFGETTNNKFGLKWKPVDSLLLRATASDGFRAPTIADLFGGGSQTFSNYTDPCDTVFGQSTPGSTVRANCARDLGALAATYRQLGQGFNPAGAPNTQTPVAFTSGSNPTLTPELSKSQTIGAVWSPSFVEGLNIALDWWKIRIADTIVADSPNNILNDCYVQGITSRCSPALFTRDPALGIPTVTFGGQNAGFRKVEGFDFDVSYRFQTESMGNFTVASNSTYTAKDYFVSTNSPTYATSNVGFANASTAFRVRSNLNVGWTMGAFGVSWMARYYSSMKEGCTYFVPGSTTPNLECNEIVFAPNGALTASGDPVSAISRRRRVGSTTFNDVQFRWEAPWNATVALGANNVFEKVGPVMYTQPQANVSYYGGFDIGRFLYMKYTQRF
ncbi:TonB-dependent receptor domain-containing protein [Lysobacter koreensis]|uniref:TonB-dependent receptor domain-containing protein n=1 Tax=Lysobacter koreensis TaxID=266122 RepID=A0ABW2YN65_9GAMM